MAAVSESITPFPTYYLLNYLMYTYCRHVPSVVSYFAVANLTFYSCFYKVLELLFKR